jgi:hypothetical protein
MVVIIESEEFLPCELCVVVRGYGVWDPEEVDDVCEEFDGFFRPDLRDQLGLYPLGELVYSDKQVGMAPRRLLEGPNQVKPPDCERTCDRDCVERLSWQMGLLSVELAPFAGADDPLDIGYYGGPIETLSKNFSD